VSFLDAWERCVRALEFEEPDRVPIYDFLYHDKVVEKVTGVSPSSAPQRYLRGKAEAFHFLGIDMTPELDYPFKREIIESGGFVHVRDGYLHWIKERPFKSVEDILGWRPIFGDNLDSFVATFREKQKMLGNKTMLIGGTGGIVDSLVQTLGHKFFFLLLYHYPKEIEAMLDANADGILKAIKVYAENQLAPAIMWWEDIAYRNGLLMAPETLRGLLIPRLKKAMKPLHKAGIKVIFHSDGNVQEPFLGDLVDAGIDGLNPIQPDAGMDLAYVKEKYGNRLVLSGNLDTQTLLHGTDVTEKVKGCIKTAAPRSGYFFGTGAGQLVWDMPVENVIAMYKAARKYGAYPKI